MTRPLHDPTPKAEPYEPEPEPYEPLDSLDSLDSFDLEDRQALRRVPGLATELEDISEVEYRQLRLERVVLVGVWTAGTAGDAELSLAELARLAETAGSQVLDGLMQRRDRPDPATYLGSGKAKEVRDIVVATGADTVICDGELTPSQLRKLEEIVKVKVIDRTALILDIFAQHARSRHSSISSYSRCVSSSCSPGVSRSPSRVPSTFSKPTRAASCTNASTSVLAASRGSSNSPMLRVQDFPVDRYGTSRAPRVPRRSSSATRNPVRTSRRTW